MLEELDIEGRRVDVRVRRSQRARHVWVKVPSRDLVEIVLPRGVAKRHVGAVLAEKRAWIHRQIAQHEDADERPDRLGLDRPGVVWIHSNPVAVETRRLEGGELWSARLNGRALVLRGPMGGSGEDARAAILRWYRREAKRRIARVVETEAAMLDVTPGRLAIRDPRTRWASCSSSGTLSFSWRLLLAPFDVLDYVVVHELCHLRELNHSASFWSYVELARPMYRRHVAWLREHERELHAYDPMVAAS